VPNFITEQQLQSKFPGRGTFRFAAITLAEDEFTKNPVPAPVNPSDPPKAARGGGYTTQFDLISDQTMERLASLLQYLKSTN
jgi:hypothetical protein